MNMITESVKKTGDATRKIAVTFYKHKRNTVPHLVRLLEPEQLFTALSKHKVSDEKDGAGFGQYQLKDGTSRANKNVVHRSGIDIDIDNGAKLDDLRAALEPYKWAAYSTHGHNPDAGAVKFRIALPFSRDVAPSEWPQVWDGCNALLGGVIDPSTKDISRMVFTPRCPEAMKQHAFFAQNEGVLIDPNTLIAFAPKTKPVGGHLALNEAVAAALKSPPPPETPENIARVKSMLANLDPDPHPAGEGKNRMPCLHTIWGIADLGWVCGYDMAREWAESGDLFDAAAFDADWKSFKPDGGIHYGTLCHYAKQAGWIDGVNTEERFTGSGGDVVNGRIFASVWRGQLLFVHETAEVLTFAQQGWISAPPGEADRAAKEVLAKLRDKAAELYKTAADDPKTKRVMAHVERTSKAPNLRAMIEMAKSEHGMTCSLNEFDADPMLLGVANGVLNLSTGALLPVSPDLLVSMRCSVEYDHDAKCPLFHKYLGVTQPDGEMRQFLQRMAGYCLTGRVDEQIFAFLYGSGANGKSVFVELQAWLLGDYSRKIATEMLMQHQRNPQGPSPDIVALKGRRFVYASETEEGRRLAEARIKDMTGGDTLTGRVPYGKADITFQPTHKLFIVGNHRPEITDNTFGMWRRVMLVPFDVTIAEADRDPQLLEKLKAEGSGILNWALEGLRQWQRHGLMVPKKIEVATAAYRDEMDIIGEWVGDHCETGAGCTVNKSEAYKAYRSWALDNGHHPLAQGRLTRRLNERGYKVQADKRTIGGLRLNKAGEFATLRLI
jgi:putative DNA primase/helicase